MQKSIRVFISAALVIGLAVGGWLLFFPSPEKVIRSRLNHLAADVSFDAGQGMIKRMLHAQQVPDYFTTNVVISADIPGHGTQTMEGRENITQAAVASRQQLQSLKVEFVGINVTLAPDKQSATVNLTAKITTARTGDFTPQEFNFLLKKVAGVWLIERVETVKTLSLLIN
jgi:hypothetical protein